MHGLLSLTVGGVPATHVADALHVSAPSQAMPFEHAVPGVTGVCVTPATASQASAVHGLPSLTVGGVPAVQVPDWHVSLPLQTVASLHEVPFAFAGFEQTPVLVLHVPTS